MMADKSTTYKAGLISRSFGQCSAVASINADALRSAAAPALPFDYAHDNAGQK